MNLFRIVFLTVAIAAISGTSYISYRGVAGFPRSAETASVRAGSVGSSRSSFGFGFGRIK
jgi:hypothetical protein